MVPESLFSPLLILRSQVQQAWLSIPNKSLNTMEAIKKTKLGTFFVILIIGLKLLTKLPKCMLLSFLSLIEVKAHLKSTNNYFSLILAITYIIHP